MIEERTTRSVSPKFLEGKKPLGCGYKVFDWSWGAKGDYCYADENGNVEGSVHTVTGKLDKCGWGLHYSKNPIDCMRYRNVIQWNKFAYVEAYDENIDCEEDGKSLCRTMKIIKVLSFEEMINAIKNCQFYKHGVCYSYDASDSYGLHDSYGVCNSYGLYDSYGIRGSGGIDYSRGVCSGWGIHDSFGINFGHGIRGSYGVCSSSGIRDSSGINCSSGIRDSSGINYSSGIGDSYGINNSHGVYNSAFCNNCAGISRCLLCNNISGSLMVFNKSVSEKRFLEIRYRFHDFGWKPNFTNALELKQKYGNGKWESTPSPIISGKSVKEAYADMPKEMIEYIKSLPEYDDYIFKVITGEIEEEQ